MTAHDMALVEHLAKLCKFRLLGWREWFKEGQLDDSLVLETDGLYLDGRREQSWNPLEPSAAMWQVFEKVFDDWGISIYREADGKWLVTAFPKDTSLGEFEVRADSGPRGICEAVGLATGFVWKEPSDVVTV